MVLMKICSINRNESKVVLFGSFSLLEKHKRRCFMIFILLSSIYAADVEEKQSFYGRLTSAVSSACSYLPSMKTTIKASAAAGCTALFFMQNSSSNQDESHSAVPSFNGTSPVPFQNHVGGNFNQMACLAMAGLASTFTGTLSSLLMGISCLVTGIDAQNPYPICNSTFYYQYLLLTPEAFDFLGETPVNNNSLMLSKRNITPALLDVLTPAIAQMCSLGTVDLSDNLLGTNALYLENLLRNFMEMGITSRLNLNIRNNNLSTGFTVLIPFLGVPHLTVSFNGINGAQAKYLASVLAKIVISYLDSSYNKIGNSGVSALAPLIPFFSGEINGMNCWQLLNQELAPIYLGSNGIGNAGAFAIAKSLSDFSTSNCGYAEICVSCLKSLDLSGNSKISTVGAAAIVSAIIANNNCINNYNSPTNSSFLCYYWLQNLNLCGSTVPYGECANMYTILSAAIPGIWFGCGANYTSTGQYSCQNSPLR